MTKNQCEQMDESFGWDVRQNIEEIRANVKEAAQAAGRAEKDIVLMAVTKTVPPERVNVALQEGICLLGENRVQEICQKAAFYRASKDKIHFIGHLQTNKIRDIIEKVSMIESVDSLHLAQALSRECEKRGMEMDILLQVNIGKEETKSGFYEEEVLDAVERIAKLPGLKAKGLMTIPPRFSGTLYFEKMQELFLLCKEKKIEGADFSVLSMGMSDDYREAIACGSTQIRLGRAIFGKRPAVKSH